jgi:hypothetical protein
MPQSSAGSKGTLDKMACRRDESVAHGYETETRCTALLVQRTGYNPSDAPWQEH